MAGENLPQKITFLHIFPSLFPAFYFLCVFFFLRVLRNDFLGGVQKPNAWGSHIKKKIAVFFFM